MESKKKRWCAFPEHDVSETIEPLTYPEKNFKFVCEQNVKVFVPYMNGHQKIYFDKRKLVQKYIKHLTDVGKGSQIFGEFYPNEISWNRVITRLKRHHVDNYRHNVDTRTSFKFGNKFLVKVFFTFGQRTVAPGRAHIYQTLDVPLLFFLMTRRGNLKVEEGYFPYEELEMYDRRILMPNGCYKIPEGTTYFIFTTQKTFFSLDVVNEPFCSTLVWENPVEKAVRKIPDLYDPPAKTPYIEDNDHDETEECFSHYFKVPEISTTGSVDILMEQTGGPTLMEQTGGPTLMEQQQLEPTLMEQTDGTILMEQQLVPTLMEDGQQITFFMIPQPAILEKNIIVTSPEFVDSYQKLHTRQYDDPNLCILHPNPNELDPEPMDLTTESINLDDLIQFIDVDQNEMDDIINDLCSPHAP